MQQGSGEDSVARGSACGHGHVVGCVCGGEELHMVGCVEQAMLANGAGDKFLMEEVNVGADVGVDEDMVREVTQWTG